MIKLREIPRVLAITIVLLILQKNSFAQPNLPEGIVRTRAPEGLTQYNTKLSNLVSDKKNVIDHRNYFSPEFARDLDRLLVRATRSKQDCALLKRRLISGPESDPTILLDRVEQRIYFYYEACQAHACDETNLRLLYEPRSKTMVGSLTYGGKHQFLGPVSHREKQIFENLGDPVNGEKTNE